MYAGDVRQGDFPRFLDGTYALGAPVYAIAGAYEDVAVLAKMRSGQYKVPNLHLLDETHSVLIAPNLRYLVQLFLQHRLMYAVGSSL